MDLSRIAIEPRLRDGWEAVDMGVAMARTWWWPLQLCWLVPSAIVFCAALIIFSDNTWLAFLITWWLNPLWDRFPLLLASRALFAEPLNVKAVWADWWSLFKIDWFSWLTWRRFSPTRSLDMPVTVLEQLRGNIRSRRLGVLHRTSAGVAVALTLLCMVFEFMVLAALWVLVLLLLPADYLMQEMFSGFSELFWSSQWSVILWYVVLALVAPFYVVCGFALYINRRIELEGWDIEIRFRHIAQRFQPSDELPNKNRRESIVKKIAGILLPLIICCNALAPTPVRAQTSNDADTAKQSIIEVLESDDFNRVETRSGWRFKQEAADTADQSDSRLLESLAKIADFFAPFFSFVATLLSVVPLAIWVILVLLMALALYHFRDALSSLVRKPIPQNRVELPELMFGLDLRKESLPDNVPVEVQRQWQAGNHREAMGLLYRATLSGLMNQFAFDFYAGFTEQECARLVQQGGPEPLSQYVHTLTRAWQSLAYAHHLPADEQVTALCSEWPRHFEGKLNEK